jgi:hypothetical protein
LQSQESEIRTDTRANLQELPEILHEISTGSIPEDDSSEESFKLHNCHKDQNSRLQHFIFGVNIVSTLFNHLFHLFKSPSLDASKRCFSICLILIVYKWRQCLFITVKYCLFDVATLLCCHKSSKK